MRDFKFRAWDLNEKRMIIPRKMEFVPATGFWISSEQKHIYYEGSDEISGVETYDLKDDDGFPKKARKGYPLSKESGGNLVLMQWTGLEDKKGKEIYEGDIVMDVESNNLYEVLWMKKYSGFVLREFRSEPECLAPDVLNDWVDVIRVVGNVFDKKEEGFLNGSY